MKSIKRSLNLRQAFIQVLIFGMFSFGIYHFVENRLLVEFDHSLETLAYSGAELVEVEKEDGVIEIEVEDDHAPAYDHDSTIFIIRNPAGKILFNPDQVDVENWSLPAVPKKGVDKQNETFPDGRSARSIVMTFMPQIEDGAEYHEGEWSVTVIRERSSIDEALETILWGCLGFGGLALVISLVASYLSVRQGLNPLDEIGVKMMKLEMASLDHRFEVESLPQEIQPIVLKINELFDRINADFLREKRFTSHAAHELRTPLAELQTILQVGQRWRPEDLPESLPSQYFNDGVEVTQRMSRLLETLFLLSREKSETLETACTEFSLVEVLSKQIKTHPQVDRFRFESSARIPVLANQELFIATLTNLLNNAVSHSKGEITVEVEGGEQSVAVLVKNMAPELTKDDLVYMREPFWRKESSHSNHDHLGLGLNLVESFCRSQSWVLDFSLNQENEFCVKVSGISKVNGDFEVR